MALSAEAAPLAPAPFSRLSAAITGPNAFAYAIILPAILLRLTYSIVPLVQTIWLSFTNTSITNPGRFIGLANWQFLLRDETLIASLSFTLVYTVISVTLQVVLGL